mmetsp:Transcript_41912/g.110723  ORF Transcript_41912/g.110723 Transcript_41912/m.110723 type:complete len:652 (+) Transcript_41912:46-2001(+)
MAARMRAQLARNLAQALRPAAPAQPAAVPGQSLVRGMAASGKDMTSGVMYNWRVAAVHNALAQRGKAEGPLTIEDLVSLGHLDQYHYLGAEACDEAIQILGLEAGAKLLDVGSGIGGPARYMAAKSGCSITGVELQADLTKAAGELTARVGLADRVKFLTGDFVSVCEQEKLQGQFDHVMSLLVFCHFADRTDALRACHDSLKPGGTFLIEDLTLIGSAFKQKEVDNLRDVVCTPGVTSIEQYAKDLEAVGFVDIDAVELSAPWKKWTQARHEKFRDSRAETVKMHGQENFDSRCAFYEVVDALFAGGNLGGARITGRKPSVAEKKLYVGRRAGQGRVHTAGSAVLNELGLAVDRESAAAAQPEAAGAQSHAQPLLPAPSSALEDPQYHDSLQYHFFFPGIFVAGRIFHTKTLQHHSAWMYDISAGKMTELFVTESEDMVQRPGADFLDMESSHLLLKDAPDAGKFVLRGAGIDISFKQNTVVQWLPSGQTQDNVIHRPDLRCTAKIGDRVLEGTGYSKRYYGLYPRFWGYRFFHGVTTDAVDKASHFWTADAAFGDNKYNYWKVLGPDGSIQSAETSDTWQQDTSAFAMIGGQRHEIRAKPLCTWDSVIGGPGKTMESKMQNRYCEVELIFGDKKRRGVAYNERCYGTLG